MPYELSISDSSDSNSTAMAALDYASFPHIFADMIKHCDLPTQNRLRLLSSSAKNVVDRQHCRYLLVIHERNRLQLFGLYSREEIAISPFFKLPFLQKWKGMLPVSAEKESEEIKALEFAMRNTRFVGLHAPHVEALSLDHGTSSSEASNASGSDRSSNEGSDEEATDDPVTLDPPPSLQLLHRDTCIKLTHAVSALPDNQLRHSIRLPPVNELQVDVFNHLGRTCACDPRYRVVHSASKLQIAGIMNTSSFCSFPVTVLTPEVRELDIVVDDLAGAGAYIDVIRGRPINPRLKVTVYCAASGSFYPDWPDYQSRWGDDLGVPVDIRFDN